MLLNILNQIQFAKGKDKEEVIRSINGKKSRNIRISLKTIVTATYKQGISYYITDVEYIGIYSDNDFLFEPSSDPIHYSLFDGLTFLEQLNKKGSATKEDKDQANKLFTYMDEGDAIIFQRIIRRDLCVGASLKTFRKVWGKDFCPDFPKSLCSTFDETKINKHINFSIGAISQLKSDGCRAQFVKKSKYTNYATGIYTRNGSKILGLDHIIKDAKKLVDLEVLDGELVVLDENGEVLPREKGNGIITKCIKGTAKNHEKLRVRFVVWDCIDILEFSGIVPPVQPYIDRYHKLINLGFDNTPTNISIIETKFVYNLQEAKQHYNKMIARKEEGTILKDRLGVWGDKRLLSQFKFKEEHEVDALVVGWYYGKKGSKYENMIGGFECESRCGTVKFCVGSGLRDNIRKSDGDSWINKILECKYNYRTFVSDREQCLFLPRVVEPRFDKFGREEANSVQEMIEQEEANRALNK